MKAPELEERLIDFAVGVIGVVEDLPINQKSTIVTPQSSMKRRGSGFCRTSIGVERGGLAAVGRGANGLGVVLALPGPR